MSNLLCVARVLSRAKAYHQSPPCQIASPNHTAPTGGNKGDFSLASRLGCFWPTGGGGHSLLTSQLLAWAVKNMTNFCVAACAASALCFQPSTSSETGASSAISLATCMRAAAAQSRVSRDKGDGSDGSRGSGSGWGEGGGAWETYSSGVVGVLASQD
jgi:hypothetical protein